MVGLIVVGDIEEDNDPLYEYLIGMGLDEIGLSE